MQVPISVLQPQTGQIASRCEQSLNVLSLNIAHGRGLRAHQLFLPTRTIQQHLEDIAALTLREQVDIAGFQETDISSFWNGQFNHLRYISRLTGEHHFGGTAEHMTGPKLQYGTAILSRYPLLDFSAQRFSEQLPLPRKGFIAATSTWPGDDSFRFLIISVHLDFLRARNRGLQVQSLTSFINDTALPCVVLGDFNCTWDDQNSALQKLCRACHLTCHRTEDSSLFTFPARRKRWDWIVLSAHFAVIEHKILHTQLSDHLPVWAKIERRG